MAQLQSLNPAQIAQSTPQPASVKNRFGRWFKRESFQGYLFISPWIIGFILFGLGPLLTAIYNSMTSVTLFKPGEWVGFENYEQLFLKDRVFSVALQNMAIYIGMAVPLTIVLSLFFAVLLSRSFPGNHVFRTIIYIPSLLVGAASAMLFKQIFGGSEVGLINQFIGALGLPQINWLNNSDNLQLAFIALVLTNIWFVGGTMVIFLAGIKVISPEYYEAAKIDGANNWSMFTHITLPLLSPTIVFNVIMVLIGHMQIFDMPLVFAAGGGAGFAAGASPMGYKNNLATFMTYIYYRGFVKNDIGYASALAVVVFIILIIFTLLILWAARTFTYYGDQVRES